ncbi:MAG: iron-containing alcohol dehydrogenase [Oscillospiraceae bacterium]|nr:iron-containing alcohol dehydrogenase [Oscillospiraceae bacterium]
MKEFDIKTKIYFGPGALERLEQIPYHRCLIIADPFVVTSGLIRLILEPLEKNSAIFRIFDDVVPDPPIGKIVAGIQALTEFDPDSIVAVGGGSAIDSAKAIREIAIQTNPNRIRLPLIAIPTTSGTGSEVTSFSVISDPDNHTKYPLVSDSMLPEEAILDVELVRSVPAAVTANTGMDVFTHALESYVSLRYNEFSASLAEKAIEIVGSYLLRSFLDAGDTHARQKMHVASTLAGLAFNASGLGLNHGMAHQLGAQFHVPHGAANAMLLPHIIEFNSQITPHSKSRKEYDHTVRCYVTLARVLGLQNFNTITTVRALIAWTQFMMKEMDMPINMSSTGTCTQEEYEAAIPAMVEGALADACTVDNPRRPTKHDVAQIYRALW